MQSYTDGDLGVKIFSKKGIVLSSNVRSETHVSSSGGGGYLHEGTGHVSAPRITSTVHRQQNIWIETPGGLEECIRLKGCDLQVRQGNRVTFVLTGRLGEDVGYYAMLVNHDAARWSQIASASKIVSWLKLLPDEGRMIASLIVFTAGLGALGIGIIYWKDLGHKSSDMVERQALVAIGALLVICSFFLNARRKEEQRTAETIRVWPSEPS